MLSKNVRLYEIKENLSSTNPGSLTTLGEADESALTAFKGRINSDFEGIGSNNWDSDVRTSIQSNISSITAVIDTGIKASQFISGGESPVKSLKDITEQYVTKYDAYASKVNNPPSPKYKQKQTTYGRWYDTDELTDEYASWQRDVKAYEDLLPKLESEALRIEGTVKNYFAAINLNTNTIDASIYVAGSEKSTFDFDEEFENYKDDSQEIDFSETEASETAAYFDGRAEVESEERSNETVNVEKQDDGTSKERKTADVETTYKDGSKFEGHEEDELIFEDINGDGKVDDDDRKIYEEVRRNGTFTDTDGRTYDAESLKTHDYDTGVVTSSTQLTDQEDGLKIESTSEYTDLNNDGNPDGGVETALTMTEIPEERAQELVDGVLNNTGSDVDVTVNDEYGSETVGGKLAVTMGEVTEISEQTHNAGEDMYYGAQSGDLVSITDTDNNQVYSNTRVSYIAGGSTQTISATVAADNLSGRLVITNEGSVATTVVEERDGQWVEASTVQYYDIYGNPTDTATDVTVIDPTITTYTLTPTNGGDSVSFTACGNTAVGRETLYMQVSQALSGGNPNSSLTYDDIDIVLGRHTRETGALWWKEYHGYSIVVDGVEYEVTQN